MKQFLYNTVFFLFFSSLSFSQINGFYGVSKDGGTGDGLVFKTDLSGNNPQALYNFHDSLDYCPGYGMIKALSFNDSIIYGIANEGKYGFGLFFEYNTHSKKYINHYDFSFGNGAFPFAIMKATDNNIYGLTTTGGTNSSGTLFEFNTSTKVLTTRFHFVAAQARIPKGNLIQAPNGKLYGTTNNVGSQYRAMIFEFSLVTNSLTVLSDLTTQFSIQEPRGLTLYNDSIIYGVTNSSLSFSHSSLFKYNINSNVVSNVYDLSAQSVKDAESALTLCPNGKLYGVSEDGGFYSKGTLYEYTPATNTVVKKADFNGVNGQAPVGGLILSSNGKLYGTAPDGGTNLAGTLFKYTAGSTVINLAVNFNSISAKGGSALCEFSDGKLYGSSFLGSFNHKGFVYKYDTTGNNLSGVFNFGAKSGNTPIAGLTQGKNGMLFGFTKYDVYSQSSGFLYQFNPYTNRYTKKLDLKTFKIKGSDVSLTPLDNGNFLFAANKGVTYDTTALIEYVPASNSVIVRHIFPSNSATYPGGELAKANNGNYYGFCSQGIYEYDPLTYSVTIKQAMTGYGNLTLASNNKFYFVSPSGGTTGDGAIYEFDYLLNTCTKKIDFVSATTGGYMQCNLTEASAGKLYGATYFGGANNRGTIFEYNCLSNVLTVKHHYTIAEIDLSYTNGTLLKASNGNIYGMTINTITDPSRRQIFEFNPVTLAFSTKLILDGEYGKNLINPKLLEISGNQVPAFDYFESDSLSFCAGAPASVSLNSPNTSIYEWYKNGVLQASHTSDSLFFPSITPADTGLWHCVLQNSFGNNTTSSVSINIASRPTLTVSATSYTLCQGQSVTLTSTGATTYTWTNNVVNNQPFTVNVTDSFTVVGETVYGCKDTSGIKLTIHPTPVVSFNYTNTTVCLIPGTRVALSAGSPFGGTYSGSFCVNDTILVDDVIANWGSGPIVYTYHYADPVTTCSASATATVTFNYCTSTGIENALNTDYKLYPNPGTGLFTLELSSDAMIVITTTLGEIVYAKKEEKGMHSIDLRNNSNGLYFVSIENDKRCSFKLMKQ